MNTCLDDPTAETSSAHVVFSINPLLINILRRLPIKSIITSKLVCKHWNSVITNPGYLESAVGLIFRFSQESWYTYVPFSIDAEPRGPPFELVLDFIKDTSGVKILQSCNGLLLCCSDLAIKSKRYYVCNPTIKKYSTLPGLDRRRKVSNLKIVRGLNLAFDPCLSPYYTVVCVRESRFGSKGMYQFEVYSSNETAGGTWRVCGEPFAAKVDFRRGVYWNNGIHWISVSKTGESIYFNLDDQMVKVMPTPPILDGDDSIRNCYFGESYGHLHYIDTYKGVNEFNVYEMRRDYSEWFVKYRAVVSNLFSISTLVRGVEDEESFLILQIQRKQFVKYHIVGMTCESLCDFWGTRVFQEHGFTCSGAKFAFQYIESFCYV